MFNLCLREDAISDPVRYPERERRFLGCIRIPLSAVYQTQVLEGNFKLEVSTHNTQHNTTLTATDPPPHANYSRDHSSAICCTGDAQLWLCPASLQADAVTDSLNVTHTCENMVAGGGVWQVPAVMLGYTQRSGRPPCLSMVVSLRPRLSPPAELPEHLLSGEMEDITRYAHT